MAASPLAPRPAACRIAAIVVAAGAGLRAGQPVPKQFAPWRGKPLVRHAVEGLANAGIGEVVVVIPEGAADIAQAALRGLDVNLATGGNTRQLSVRAGLEALAADPPELVLIHDAARPVIPADVIERLVAALETHDAAIPVLPVVDSVVEATGDRLLALANRERLRRVQTPQAFRFAAILAAHRGWPGVPDAGDDAQVALAAGCEVTLVPGDERLHKMTFAHDFVPARVPFRVGSGFDVHRLVPGAELWLCGLKIDHDHGLEGHSDADVALHAVVDALLGAIGAGDIGTHFPPSDPQWRGAASASFVAHATSLVSAAGYAIGNLDLTMICEAPKIGPHRAAMRENLARLLGVQLDAISVKATTTERLGFAGRGEGIAAQALATLCLP